MIPIAISKALYSTKRTNVLINKKYKLVKYNNKTLRPTLTPLKLLQI